MESRKPKRATSRKSAAETATVPAEPVKATKTTRTRKPKACAPVTPAETEIVAATPIAVTESTPVEVPAPAPIAVAVAAEVPAPAAATPVAVAAPVAPEVRAEEVAELAYHLWVSRGCPMGSPDEDWLRAEEKLRQSRNLVTV